MIFRFILWILFTWAYSQHFTICKTKDELLRKILFYIIISSALLN